MSATESLTIEHHEAEIVHVDLPERLRGHEDRFLWPMGQALPGCYVRPRPSPCARCRRMRLDDGAQAVIVMAISTDRASGAEIAYLRCKACGARWKLPVE